MQYNHHTLLQKDIQREIHKNPDTLSHPSYTQEDNSKALLSTATALAENGNKHYEEVRILLDSGSQSNFITEETCERLNLKKYAVNCTIKDIGNGQKNVIHKVNLHLKSKFNNYYTQSMLSVTT